MGHKVLLHFGQQAWCANDTGAVPIIIPESIIQRAGIEAGDGICRRRRRRLMR